MTNFFVDFNVVYLLRTDGGNGNKETSHIQLEQDILARLSGTRKFFGWHVSENTAFIIKSDCPLKKMI